MMQLDSLESAASLAEGWSPEAAQAAWFCIRSHPKHEHIAAAHLRQIPGVEVFNPQLRLVRSTRRGRVWCVESLFPNYLFARFAPQAMLERVRYTPAVKTVLQFGDRMPIIPDGVIAELRQNLADCTAQVFTDAPLEGEEVEVAVGPFQGLKAPVVRVLPAKQRVQVLLDVMGQAVHAELSLQSILFKKKEAVNAVLGRAEAMPGARLGAGPAEGQAGLRPRSLLSGALAESGSARP